MGKGGFYRCHFTPFLEGVFSKRCIGLLDLLQFRFYFT